MTSSGAVLQQRGNPTSSAGTPRGSPAGFAMAVAVYFSLALLLVQTLGLLHGIVHSPGATNAAAAFETSSQPHQAAADDGVARGRSATSNSNSHSVIAHLFSGHLGYADCRVYDQLSHFDAAPGLAAVALPLLLTPFLLSTLTGLATARWHALFQARGPPFLR